MREIRNLNFRLFLRERSLRQQKLFKLWWKDPPLPQRSRKIFLSPTLLSPYPSFKRELLPQFRPASHTKGIQRGKGRYSGIFLLLSPYFKASTDVGTKGLFEEKKGKYDKFDFPLPRLTHLGFPSVPWRSRLSSPCAPARGSRRRCWRWGWSTSPVLPHEREK